MDKIVEEAISKIKGLEDNVPEEKHIVMPLKNSIKKQKTDC